MGRRKKVTRLTNLVDTDTVKEKVCSYLKTVYESKDEPTMKRSVENFTNLYDLHEKPQKEAFFNELRFRLDFITVSSNNHTMRLRCLLLIVRTAVKVVNKVAEHDIFDFLADFCKELCDAISPSVRQWVCVLAGLMFSISVVNTAKEDEYQSVMSLENYKKLFVVLKKRWLDKNSSVRKEAIKSLTNIQDDPIDPTFEAMKECSAKEMITLSLGDKDPECRIEAIFGLSMKEPRDFKFVLKLAHHDSDLNVQKEAIRRLSEDMPLMMISVKERVDLLERIIAHSDEEIRSFLGVLLREWIAQAYYMDKKEDPPNVVELCAGSLYFLKYINFLDNEQTIESSLFGIFDRLLIDFAQVDGEEGILTLAESFSDRERANLNRLNYKKLLSMQTTLKEKSYTALHWHTLIAFCCSPQRFSDNFRADCRFKLAPTMKTYAEFVFDFLATFGSPSIRSPRRGQTNQEPYRILCIIQLLKIFPYLDHDLAGMKAWKELLFHILSSRVIELHSKLVEQVAQNLMEFHYPKYEDAEVALNEFVDAINEVVHRAYPNAANANLSQRNDTLSQDQNATVNTNVVLDAKTRKRCLTIFNGMLKTGRFTDIGANIQGLYDFIVSPSYTSNDKEDRILAYESAGIISVFHDTFCRTHCIFVLKNALQIEHKSVQLVCIDIIGDLVLAHNYETIAEMYGNCEPDDLDDNGVEAVNMNDLMNQIILKSNDKKDKQIAFAGTETLVRWLMAETRSEWKVALEHLLLLSFKQDTQDNPKLRNLLAIFFPMFAAVSRNNQMMLVEIFDPVMEKLRNRQLDGDLAAINAEDVAMWIIKWTMPNILENIGDNLYDRPVHIKLAKIVLQDLDRRGDIDNYFVYVYCKVASLLEIGESIDTEELDELISLCQEVTKDLMTVAKNLRLLNVLHKKLIKIQTIQLDETARNDPPSRTPSVMTNASSTATIQRIVTPPDMMIDEEKDPEELDVGAVLQSLRVTQTTPPPDLQETLQETPRQPKTPKTVIRAGNKKRMTVNQLTQEFNAQGRTSAIMRDQRVVQATPKAPVVGPAAGTRKNRVLKVFDELEEKTDVKMNTSTTSSRSKRQLRGSKIKVEARSDVVEEIIIDDE